MGSKIKEEAIKSLIRSDSPDILLIQETKMEDKAFLHIGKNLWKRNEGQAVSARGASGGLGTLWTTNKFLKVLEVANSHWLFTKLKHVDSDETLCLINVYAPVSAGEKKICWEFIRGLADSEDLVNIIIAGDLNLTLSLAEKRGGSIVRDLTREWVEDLLQDWDMIDIKPSLGKYTWSNRRLGPDLYATSKNTWKQTVNGSAFFVWEEKLRRVKAALKTWAISLPNPAVERKKIQECLENHHLNAENEVITKEVLDKEAELQQKLLKASLAEEEYWRVKSRRLWLKAGDRNSDFFHKQSQARKKFNSISEIKEENNTHKDIQSIKNVAFLHFKILYSEKEGQGQTSSLVNEVPTLISARKNQFLEAEVTNDEIKSALFAMEPDKAPGPDDFTARFLQIYWQIVEKDLGRMVRKSQACQKIGGSTNSAFLALILKEKGANTFSRFRPISLCNIGYKLITKVIANRLKTILPSIIPENQGGFIQGRQIVDNFILVQEVIHSSLTWKEKGMVVKLDLESAFDRVRHRFLLDVLHKFGFGPKFIT
eukprot:PITA_15209